MNKKLLLISVSVVFLFLLAPVVVANSFDARDPNFKFEGSTRTEAWIVDLQKNFDNPQWFADNLNDTDRKMVRQALDYAIPRPDIITSILNGHGYLLATTVVPQTGIYYDADVQARPNDPAKAVELLSSVFGYSYANPDWLGSDDPDTAYDETLPYFKITFTVPNTNPLRSQWAARINFAYSAIGVEVRNVLWTWTTIGDRIFDNPAGFGWDYDHGGFDGQFIGWGGGTLPGDRFFFHSESIVPVGGNYQFYNNTWMDALIDKYDTTKNATERLEAYVDFQEYFREEALRNILFQNEYIFAHDANLEGFNPYFQQSVQYQNLTLYKDDGTTVDDTFVVGQPGEFQHMNPFISNSAYDNYMISTLWYGLTTTSTTPGDLTYNDYRQYLFFADWYNVSDDELTYFFKLKTGLKFHDGQEINASHVKYSYDTILDSTGGFPAHSGYAGVLNQTNVTTFAEDPLLIKFVMSEWQPFTWIGGTFTLPILPKHVYGEIEPKNMASHVTDFGNDTTGAEFSGIIGNGPYTFGKIKNEVGYINAWADWDATYATLIRNNNQPADDPLNMDDPVPYIPESAPTIQNVTVVNVNAADVALTSLKSGELDFLDPNVGLQSIFDQIEVGGKAKAVSFVGAVWQELGLNHGSPIWGLNPIDPSVYPVVDDDTTDTGSDTSDDAPPASSFGDSVTIALAFASVAVLSYAIRKRRN